jgi:sialate O-acetylesterase
MIFPLAPGRRRWVGAFSFVLALLGAALRADVRCATAFGDHMVLQRDRPVLIWGEADPGEAVTVEFAGQSASTTATAAGHWRLALDPLPASTEPHLLTVRGHNTLAFSDVLVGEVWLCSGQSNMEKQLGPRTGQKPTDKHEEEIRQANHPLLRLFQVPRYGQPQPEVTGLCRVPCTSETIQSTEFSAAGYFFGRELVRELGVPVGLIHSSFGGTRIEAWMPPAAFAVEPTLRGLEQVPYDTYVTGVQPTELYQSMIAPLAPYTLRGFLWYQGETNCMNAEGAIYTDKMRALIASWRAVWNDLTAPFYYVQLAPFDYSRWEKFPKHLTPEALPLFWEAQARALSIPHTGMVVTTDLVAGVRDIHPTNKRDVGLRLAHLALAGTYRRCDLVAQSPFFESMRILAGGKVGLRFSHAGTGLASRDGQPLNGFLTAGEDRHFVPATAVIVGDTVILSSAPVAAPVAVRFGWDETAAPNLVNSAGLPAVPFRTDSWPVASERPAKHGTSVPAIPPATR